MSEVDLKYLVFKCRQELEFALEYLEKIERQLEKKEGVLKSE
jgi:hypothetical protein